MKVFVLTMIICLGFVSLRAATFYVDPVAGDDANCGTAAAPWASVYNPLTAAPAPAGAAKSAGEITVILQGGNYGQFILDDAMGAPKTAAAGTWITYQAAPGETPVFTNMTFEFDELTALNLRFDGIRVEVPGPAGMAKAAAAAASPISLSGASNVEYKNTSFIGSTWQSHTPCVRLANCRSLLFDRCEVSNYGSGYTINGCSDFTIRYNHIHRFSGSGIKYMTNNKNAVLEYNHIHDQQTWDESHASAISIRSGDVTVRGNIMHDGWTSSCMMFYNDDMGNTYVYNNLLIENNVMYDVTNGYYIFRINKLGTNVTIRNNTIFEPLKDAFIIHSLAPGYDGSGLKVYNNLFAGATVGVPAKATVKNNIFSQYNNSYSVCPPTNIMSGSPTVFLNGYFTDTPLITKNHGQTLDFSLASGSPAIGVGDPAFQPAAGLGSLGADGFIRADGVTRDASHHSAGAYEFSGATDIGGQKTGDRGQLAVGRKQLAVGRKQLAENIYSLDGRVVTEQMTGIYLVRDGAGKLVKKVIIR